MVPPAQDRPPSSRDTSVAGRLRAPFTWGPLALSRHRATPLSSRAGRLAKRGTAVSDWRNQSTMLRAILLGIGFRARDADTPSRSCAHRFNCGADRSRPFQGGGGEVELDRMGSNPPTWPWGTETRTDLGLVIGTIWSMWSAHRLDLAGSPRLVENDDFRTTPGANWNDSRWRRKYAQKQPMRPPPMMATSTILELDGLCKRL